LHISAPNVASQSTYLAVPQKIPALLERRGMVELTGFVGPVMMGSKVTNVLDLE